MSELGEWYAPEPVPIAPTLDLMSTCFHESGHAVGGYWYHRWPLLEIIIDDSGTSGRVRPTPGVNKDRIQYSIACLCGPIAEARYLGADDWRQVAADGGQADLNQARQALAGLADAPALSEVAGRASVILQANWKSVERVAFALTERRRLSQAEFLRVLTRW